MRNGTPPSSNGNGNGSTVTSAIDFNDVSLRFISQDGNATVALRNFSMSVARGEFVTPIVKQDGAVDYGWAPLVVSSEREAFERVGRTLWGESFALRETGADGDPFPVLTRERYFPLLYSLAGERDRARSVWISWRRPGIWRLSRWPSTAMHRRPSRSRTRCLKPSTVAI